MNQSCPLNNNQTANGAGKTTRRTFLGYLGLGSVAAFILGMTGVTFRFLDPNNSPASSNTVRAGAPGSYPDGITYVPQARAFVVKGSDGIRVLSAICTHLACTVNWSETSGRFECPCHGSVFDRDGKVLAGPAPRPLPWYQVSLAGGELLIDPEKVVDKSYVLKPQEVKGSG